MNTLSSGTRVKLANGVEMPIFGYSVETIGTEVYNLKTQTDLLKAAIDAGYRLFDTSENAGGLRALGRAVRASGIPRGEFFITSKMRTDEMGDGRYYQAIDETLLQLDMDYLDLYSIHWPMTNNRMWPKLDAFVGAFVGREIAKTDNGDSEGLISFYDRGLARAIGVCNMEIHHLEKILAHPKCTLKPMVNQSHFHPLHASRELRSFCAEHDIAFGGLFEKSELETSTRPRVPTDVNRYGMLYQTDEDRILANQTVRIHPTRRSKDIQYDPYARDKNPRRDHDHFDDFEGISKIARKYGKTNTQLIARWSMQQGVITTVKGLLPQKMKSDFDVFDFRIEDSDMQALAAFDVGMRIGYHPDYLDF